MKRILLIVLITLTITSCAAFRTLDINQLRTGMSKADVEYLAGSPNQILSVRNTSDGYQEVLGYKTNNGDTYALEFWDDYLVGYEYLYSDYTNNYYYDPSPLPPAYIPPVGQPIIIINNGPDRPGYGGNRPRPPYNNGGNNNGRPNSGRYDSGRRPTNSGTNSGRYDNNRRPATNNGSNSGRYSSGNSNSTSSSTGSTNTSSGRYSSGSNSSSSSPTSVRTSSGRTSENSSVSSGRTSSSNDSSNSSTRSSSTTSGRTSSGR